MGKKFFLLIIIITYSVFAYSSDTKDTTFICQFYKEYKAAYIQENANPSNDLHRIYNVIDKYCNDGFYNKMYFEPSGFDFPSNGYGADIIILNTLDIKKTGKNTYKVNFKVDYTPPYKNKSVIKTISVTVKMKDGKIDDID